MSQKKFDGKFPPGTPTTNLLRDMVSFGPEKGELSQDSVSQNANDRLKKLVKDIENIGKRIDKLSSQY